IINKQIGDNRLYSNHKKYFDNDGIVKRWFRGSWMCLITDPVIAKDVFLRPDVYPKVDLNEIVPNSIVTEYFGVNVGFSSGDVWKRHRRVCNPAFKALPLHLFAEIALKMMDILEQIDQKPIEINNLMQ
ncbi:7038_t:CDS:2, partial [Racocetra persica]